MFSAMLLLTMPRLYFSDAAIRSPGYAFATLLCHAVTAILLMPRHADTTMSRQMSMLLPPIFH